MVEWETKIEPVLREYEARKKILEERENICVICFDNEREIRLIPCNHFMFCENCVRMMIKKSGHENDYRCCPVCKVRVQKVEYDTPSW